MASYEYRIVGYQSTMTPQQIEDGLNDLGRDGWMLVHVNDHNHGKEIMLMRAAAQLEHPIARARAAS